MTDTQRTDASPMLADVRASLVDLKAITDEAVRLQPAVHIDRAATQEDFFEAMSPTLANAVRQEFADAGDDPLVLLRLLTDENQTPGAVLDAGRATPASDALVHLTNTVTIVRAEKIVVRSEMLTAAHESALRAAENSGTPTQGVPGKGTPGKDDPNQTPPTRPEPGNADTM